MYSNSIGIINSKVWRRRLIELKNVSKIYKRNGAETEALSNVNLQVKKRGYLWCYRIQWSR